MQITEEDKTLHVLFDNEVVRSLPAIIFKKHLKTLPSFQTKEQVLEFLDDLEKKLAKRRALYLLSKRQYFEGKLKETLQKKGFSEESTEYAVEEMLKYAYLNDDLGVEKFIEREMRQGKGPYMILQKLKHKKAKVNAEIVFSIYTREKQLEMIQSLSEKSKKKGNQLIGYLERRGFSLEVILSVIKNLEQ